MRWSEAHPDFTVRASALAAAGAKPRTESRFEDRSSNGLKAGVFWCVGKKFFSQNFILVILGLNVLLWTAGSIVQHQVDLSKTSPSLTWFREEVDFKVYFSGQGWVIPGRVLYDRGYAEYPPLGVLYVWWPRLVTDNFEVYHWLLWFSNAVFYVLAGWLTARLAKLWQFPESAWWLWLLPSAVYYSLNRFDILPVVLVLLSLYWLKKDHRRLAGASFGAAVAAKFYPILLVPLFWQLFKRQKLSSSGFIIYSLVPLLSLSLATAVASGSEALWSPYVLQISRWYEPGSVWFLLMTLWPQTVGIISILTSLGQVAVPIVWAAASYLTGRPWRAEINFKLASLTLLGVVLFNHFYSNQWWLWLLPYLALAFPVNLVHFLGAYDLVNYLEFPVVAELWGKSSSFFNWLVVVRSGLLLFIMAVLLRQLMNERPKSNYENLVDNSHL